MEFASKFRRRSIYYLLNCKHYRTEQIKLKEKAWLKNTDTIGTDTIYQVWQLNGKI